MIYKCVQDSLTLGVSWAATISKKDPSLALLEYVRETLDRSPENSATSSLYTKKTQLINLETKGTNI